MREFSLCYLWYKRVSSGHKAKVDERETDQITQVVQGQDAGWGEGGQEGGVV